MAKILLSYRRSDSAAIAGRIFDRLIGRYGHDSVFIDVDNIPFGTDFREHIRETLVTGDLLLAIVGPQWLGVRADGQSRIRHDTDPVRIEIETALQARIPIIPVLIDGTEMPQPGDVPHTIERFCYLNAAPIESGRDFHHHVDRLIKAIEQVLAIKAKAAAPLTEGPPAVNAASSPTSQPKPVDPPSEPATMAHADPQGARRQLSRRTWLIAGGAAGVTGAGLLLLALPRSTPPGPLEPPVTRPPSTTPPVGGQLRVGIGAPITGPNATLGMQIRMGAEQARDDINAVGGILGRAVSTSIGDDAGDPRQGVLVANKFVADGVRFVVGHFNSAVTLPTSDVYRENGILQITPASTNPRVTERGFWNIFRTCGRDDQQGKVAGEFIIKHFKDKKVAVVHDKTTYGQGLADETKKTMNAGGIKEVLYEGINPGEKDFSGLVSKIKAAGTDLVYWGGLHTEGGFIVRQMRDQGIKAVLMGGDGITSDEFATIGGPGVEGTLMTYSPDPRKRPEAKAIVEKFRAKNFEPESYTLYSYAAVQIIKQAAEAANSLDPKTIAEMLKSGRNFSTVIGDISYDKKGDTTRLGYVMYVWKKGPSGKIAYVEIDQ